MDDDAGYWKQNLYLLQEKAPRPILVRCNRRIFNKPPCYGEEFHGLIERPEAEMVSQAKTYYFFGFVLDDKFFNF